MTMRAIRIHDFGDPDVLELEETDDLAPAGGEVLVEVKACGLNHLDLRVRRGEFPYLTLPVVPGSDISGVNVETGQRVIVYPVISCERCRFCAAGREHLCPELRIVGVHRDGGCADRIAVPARNVIPVSEAWDFTEWAAAPLVFLTAWHALITRANLRVGETILIHSAGSGLGSAAIQIASAGGATVIATASNEVKLEKAKNLGAQHTVNYTQVDFADAVRSLTEAKGVDVVLDHVGGPTLVESVSCLARGGRLVCCGETGSPSATIALRPLFNRERTILGAYLGSRKELADVLHLLNEKTVKPVVDATFPIERTVEAHEYLEGRHAFGKVVVTMQGDA
jgi:NADPH:quinone reductase-like Zn-dependent oxidoreductase